MSLLSEQILSGKQGIEAVVVNVCAVLKNIDRYRLSSCELSQTEIGKLNQKCKNILQNKIVRVDSAMNLLDCKLARTYGICYIIVKNHEPAQINSTEFLMITRRTSIKVESVQSEDFYNLSRKEQLINLGGLDHELNQLSLLIKLNKFQISPSLRPVGVLLHGPPGCGKSSLGKHLAHVCNAVFIDVKGSEIFHSDFGVGAASLKSYFRQAVNLSKEGFVIVFIDEIDCICPEDENASLGNKQLTSALVAEMDNLHENNVSGVLVLAATNFISSVSRSLRRPGHFDREVLINVPSKEQRSKVLEVHTRDLRLGSDVSLSEVASWTMGFVGADLKLLCEEAANYAQNGDRSQDNEKSTVQKSHFTHALHTVRPSLKKGLNCVVDFQPVEWGQIGGLDEVKAEIKQSIEWPLLYPDALCRLDLSPTKGILLYGPPGCCKTTLVRAAATSCHVTLLALSGAQVYSPYVGESERIISEAFRKARALSPAILFFDEIESLVGTRSSGSGQSKVQERILSTMLNEMDGIGIRLDDKMDAALARQKKGSGDQKMINGSSYVENQTEAIPSHDRSHVIIIGATNRPDMLDPAILRPGRMDKLIYVPPPDLEGRQAILNIQISQMPALDIDVEELSRKTQYFSGADLKNFCKEAGLFALRENLLRHHPDFSDLTVTNNHFVQALEVVKASLTESMLQEQRRL